MQYVRFSALPDHVCVIKALQIGLLYNSKGIMVLAHTDSKIYLDLKDEVEEMLTACSKLITEEDPSGEISFRNSENTGGAKVVVIDDAQVPIQWMQKSIDVLHRAKVPNAPEDGTICVEKNLKIPTFGVTSMQQLGVCGNMQKTRIVADPADKNSFPKYMNSDRSSRQVSIKTLSPLMKDFRYLPTGNGPFVEILHLLSTSSMLLHKMVSFVHNWYAVQLYRQRPEMKQWINKNWAMVAMSAKDLDLKNSSDLDPSKEAHLQSIVETILSSSTVKEMPFGGYFAEPVSDGDVFSRVTAKTFNLRPSKLPTARIEWSWHMVVAAHARMWEKEMKRTNRGTHDFGILPSTEINEQGLPINPVGFFEFVEKHIDPHFIAQVRRYIDENYPVNYPKGNQSTECFDLLQSNLQPVTIPVDESGSQRRTLMVPEYYSILERDVKNGTICMVLGEVSTPYNAKNVNIYLNMCALRTLVPGRTMSQMRGVNNDAPVDPNQKIVYWNASDGVDNIKRACSLETKQGAKESLQEYEMAIGGASSLCGTNKRSLDADADAGPLAKRPCVQQVHSDTELFPQSCDVNM